MLEKSHFPITQEYKRNKLFSWNKTLQDKPKIAEIVEKFHVLLGIGVFIAIFTIAHHWSLF
jgi:hypothetical protein